MLTPSHMIYGWVIAKATKRAPDKARTLAFVTGGLLPDLPTYVFFLVHTFLIGSTQQLMWDTLYFDSAWTPIITLSHSLVLWPLILVCAAYTKRKLLTSFATAALLHVALDFFVHHDDAYRHFWPLSNWKFVSPVSYWDAAHHGTIVSLLDAVLIVTLLVWLTTIYRSRNARIWIGAIISLYVVSQMITYVIL